MKNFYNFLKIKLLYGLIFFCFFAANIFAQTDSTGNILQKVVKYSPDFKFRDGIFLNFDAVKNNSPIPKTRIITSLDYRKNDFFNKLFQEGKIFLYDQVGQQVEVEAAKIWGYSDKGILYIRYNEEFNRISVLGSLCHFVANKTTFYEYYDPYSYSPYQQPTQTSQSVEMHQYVLNFETGDVKEFSYENIEIFLMSDTTLYDEYNALKKKKKEQLKFLYLRRFNEKHPIYFPTD